MKVGLSSFWTRDSCFLYGLAAQKSCHESTNLITLALYSVTCCKSLVRTVPARESTQGGGGVKRAGYSLLKTCNQY